MKPYFIGMAFVPIFILTQYAPLWVFMLVAFSMLFAFCHMFFNYKEPEYEWPELSFHQSDNGKMITLTMTTKDGKRVDRYLSTDRLVFPKAERIVEKTQSSIWHVLGMMPTTDRNAVEKAFRKMSLVYHPDAGGTSSAFNTLMEAKEKALQKCR